MKFTVGNIEITLRDKVRWKTQKRIDAMLYQNASNVVETDKEGHSVSKTTYNLEAFNKSQEIMMEEMIEKILVDGQEKPVAVSTFEEYFDVEIADRINDEIAKIREKREEAKKK